ncbi:hypothetical protein CesoFtcFv8_024424 [Champsocephalus esox]|uniref:C2H2-type domain-containing protein n=1 Tax=Champsocephalus esox TaxID=159716 RepID=A0AAN8GII5_9TELE|nr:hypothetical protein CesoFtcFv8_024424 [Champsocephalus esox]
MGDMNTPDFDDLLAAFDIPDMVDPKAAFESGPNDDHDGQLKQPSGGVNANDDESQNPSHDIGVSVIVKNIRNKNTSRPNETISETDEKFHSRHYTASIDNALYNGFLPSGQPASLYTKNGWNTPSKEGQPVVNQSPTFNQLSPSSAEEFDDNDKIEVDDPMDKQGGQSFFKSMTKTESPNPKSPVSIARVSSTIRNRKPDQNNNTNGTLEGSKSDKPPQLGLPEGEQKETVLKSQRLESKEAGKQMDHVNESIVSQFQAKSSAKLSSCIAAIVALSENKSIATDLPVLNLATTQKELTNTNPIALVKPHKLESALEFAKRLLTRQPDSPTSVMSEGSSKDSPASSTDTPTVIPKVRIKTIKTSSGQIKRTLTRVVPEFSAIFSSLTRPSLPIEITKQITIKPVATAFVPVSAVKTTGSQVINLKLANNITVKATVIPAASMQSASSAILKAAKAMQQQTQVKHQTSLAGRASKKVSTIQVFTNSQSSVVDAFNKVLSSVNPVPVYVPNLSPTTSACISLPSRGYKCLECGDSFALEKSLTHHFERRSVRIEVTCNHCAKGLVFYNKCSLLSHARGHKDKGVVMQCSHLILKPIPVDQMITPSPSSGPANLNGIISNSQVQAPASQIPGRVASEGSQTKVISAPCSAPLVAAMPLGDDALKVCRHSLKCLECNKMFQDGSSLAIHYQQAVDSSGQKSCTICQMLLPNQCSFQSHQRIHQHKSPHICPECGASCRSVHFQSHVTKNCLHYSRRVGYRCIHCSVIFADIASVKSHIQSSHCEIFYKCPLCPMAFKTAPGTHSHANTQHPGMKAGEPKMIYKCSMCDTVFTSQSLLNTHFDQHIVNQKVSVFKCPDCFMQYAQKQLMMDHIKAIHGTLKTIEGPPNLGINLPLGTMLTNSNNNNSNSPKYNTNKTNNNNKDGGNVNSQDKGITKPSSSPRKKTHTNCSSDLKSPPCSGYTCGDCRSLFSSREVFVVHMRSEHGKILKKHPCRQCEKSFSSSHSLCRHNRLKHKELWKVYTCPHCPALSPPFSKRVLLDQHIHLTHGVKEGKTVNSDNTEVLPDKDTTLSPKRKPEEDEESPGLMSRGSGSQPLKRLKCQECGLCYTSHRSLARHLFIVHRLKEQQGLALYNGRDKDDEESQRENQLDITPNTKCKVCGMRFETEGNLNTHMRTHGMAFIKSKRLSAAEK